MSQYPHARFVSSANKASQFLPDTGREVAFAGRSNAGKSSVVNTIVNRRQFARTSKTPGRTQLINFFELAEGKRLVDLPGYGFARVSDATRDHWGELITGYFHARQSLAGLFVIVDIRRGLRDGDIAVLSLAESVGLPAHVLLNKADKLKRGQRAAALADARSELGDRCGVALFSALKREGLEEARAVLDGWLEG